MIEQTNKTCQGTKLAIIAMTAFGLQVPTKKWGLLVHGGVSKPDSNKPISAFFSVTNLQEGGPPLPFPSSDHHRLSHHAGVVLPTPLDHLLVIVGGWDGRRRTSDVRCFNLKDRKWIDLKEHPPSDASKYHAPVGLSNHTVDVINTKGPSINNTLYLPPMGNGGQCKIKNFE